MRKLITILIILISIPVFGQDYGNEWIDYNQEYFHFKISEDGIYRITYQDLISQNIALSSINPQNIQIIARGKEVPLYIEGESDGIFNVNDFIEFYATHNDGWVDSVFYKGRVNQPNPYYSLINDTISYYLTWNTSTSNSRIALETAIDFGNYFPASFFWKEVVYNFNSTYYDGETFSNRSTDPEYVKSEGYLDGALTKGGVKNYSLNFKNRFVSGPFVKMEVQFTGQSNWGAINNGDHHVRIQVGSQLVDDIFEAYDLRTLSLSFSPSELISGNNNLTYSSIDDRNSDVDRSAMAFIKYSYPHNLVLNTATEYDFMVDNHAAQPGQYLEFINFNGGTEPILYDLTNNKRVRVLRTLSTYKTIIPNGTGRKSCYITASSNIKSVQLHSVGSNNKFVDYELLAVDSAYLFLTHKSLYSVVTQYAAYRSGQGYNPMIIDVNELYHQFGYGIEQNPLAIRNFIYFCLEEFNTEPEYLFLVGKSISPKLARQNQNNYVQNLVPSFGNPTADNLLVSGLGNTFLESPIPIGRLSAKDLNDVSNYLSKVVEYETAPNALWMKKAAHFAGGLSLSETNQFEGYMNNFAKEFESLPLGGRALLFKKSTSIPIQTTLSDSIRSLINNGVSLMTFFGHASATGGFDISIDSPDKLNNRGRYPAIIANSCFSGNYHQPDVLSTAEEYVLEKNKGSISFMASGNLGFASTLNAYSSAFYKNLATDNYGLTLAENMIETVKDIQGINPQTALRLVCLEMSLQGDPAIRLNPQTLPDYVVGSSSVSYSPNQITSDLDSFNIQIKLNNQGLSTSDTVEVQLTRQFPLSNSNDTNLLKLIPKLFYEEYVEFTLSVDILRGIGVNNFTFLIDPNNKLPELEELNNRVDFNILIRSGELIPIYPYDFSIVGEQGISLKASTAYALEEELSYVFELDTTNQFNSLLRPTEIIQSAGGIIEWSPNLLNSMQDSLVYFWRVSKVPAPGEPYNWRSSSFQYIPNESGWSQDHFEQFTDNDYLFINPNNATRKFEYVDNVKELYVFNAGTPDATLNNEIRYQVDADTRERNACGGQAGFLIAVLDSLSLDSWQTPYNGSNPQNYFGQANFDTYCGNNRTRSEKYFLFRQVDTLQMYAMRDFLNNVIPDGNYVVAYTWQKVNYSAIWGIDSSILQSFEQLGSNLISTASDDHPFIFTAQVGNDNSVQEIVGSNATDQIEIRRTLTTSSDFGEITSPLIGTSKNWERLYYKMSSLEPNSDDSVRLQLNGIFYNGFVDNITEFDEFELDTNIESFVRSVDYEYLQLKLIGYDETSQTAPQIERWQVSFQEIPDLALAPNIHFKINNDTLQEGEPLELEIAIKNVSNVDFDSVLIDYSVLNKLNQIVKIPYPIQQDLPADSVFVSRVIVPTRGLLGSNKLLIEVNPNEEEIEKFSFNNVAQLDFVVQGDRINPLVDVTFDGRRILNREIISAKPEIVINLKDDNNYLALDDTSSFQVSMIYPNGVQELLNFGTTGGDIMQFIPAVLPNNNAQARITPNLPQDGIYRLVVQAYDKSGNASGKLDYEIEFEIVNESSITHLVNYPNPFSTSTRFVFTLTGSEIPDQILIQIMTVTGKVVREINQYEIGPLHIGNNITQFAWDGKDEFGDQLANGVYLYRVKTKINGNNIIRRESGADQFFTKEFGKMYLLR